MRDGSCIKLAILGLGTVGSGVVQTLQTKAVELYKRVGLQFDVQHILVQNVEKDRGFPTSHLPLTNDVQRILDNDGLDLVIEVMGGIEPAKTIIENSIRKGSHIITANKELIAKYGKELFQLAQDHGVQIYFEASVAGGIPIIHTLQTYLQVNQVRSIRGILNGTCNYILTQMAEYGKEYSEALLEAQQKGYAEADPNSDVEGYDAAYKLAILARLGFGLQLDVDDIPRIGISSLQSIDIRMAKTMGYVIKSLAEANRIDNQIQLRVTPQLLPLGHPFAHVDDVLNAVLLETDVVGELTLIGRGAGQYPTASAVVEDLVALITRRFAQTNKNHHESTGHRIEASTVRIYRQVPLVTNTLYIRCNCVSLDTIEIIQQRIAAIAYVTEWRILESRNGDTRYYSLGGVVVSQDASIETLLTKISEIAVERAVWVDPLILPMALPESSAGISLVTEEVVNL